MPNIVSLLIVIGIWNYEILSRLVFISKIQMTNLGCLIHILD